MWTKLIQEHIMTTQFMKDIFQDCTYTIGNETRLKRSGLFERKCIHMRKIFIPWGNKSTNRYNLNVLRIITPIYHMYIEYE